MKKETVIILIVLILVIGGAAYYFTSVVKKTANKTIDKSADAINVLAGKSADIKGSLDDISHIADVVGNILKPKNP